MRDKSSIGKAHIKILARPFCRVVACPTNEFLDESLAVRLLACRFEVEKVGVHLFSLLLGYAVLETKGDNVSYRHPEAVV